MTNFRPGNATDEGINEEHVMQLAETTDVSPQQARELLKKHRGDLELATKEARAFKAES